jgi:ribonuclease G
MSKELVISANRHETKVAILEEDQLVEIYFQRANEYSLAGSIHKGRVTRVLPGMQSAFVDLGLERDTFLYVSDFFEENEEYDRILPTDKPSRQERQEPARVESAVVDRTPPEAAPSIPDPEEPEEVAEAAEAPVSVGAPEQQQQQPRTDRPDDDRDRRGRRSRRRRNRGRGFPDSKYATEAVGDPKPAETIEQAAPTFAAAPAFTPAPPPPTHGDIFPVLPGESLAKYSRPVEEEERGAHEPEPQPVAAAPEPVAETVSPVVEESDEASAVEEIISEEREGAPFTPEEIADINQPVVEMIEVDDFDAVNVPADEADEGDEDEEESAEVGSVGGAAPAIAAEPTPATEASAPLTAHVREQGGRYMHRQGRRMRRKGRGGQAQEGVASAGPANTSPRPEAQPTPRPDAEKTVSRPDARSDARSERSLTPSITELLKEGQEIIVQIAKEPLGQKGARITSHIALPGRYVVYMPTLEHMGVSRKIASDEERLRLKKILQGHRGEFQGGFIVRTAGEGKTEEDISADMNFLSNLWLDIRHKSEKKPAPLLLHHDLDIVQRILRDQVSDTFKSIWVDSEEVYESILRFVQRFQPALVTKVKLYTRSAPIFDAFNITAELEKALRPKVWLKSGGYIVINQTEALVAIDINTGKYVGKSNRLEDTIVKTNTEAVKEIVRQIRLRDLGGIIVVDFIDMDERRNRAKVMQALEEAMRADKAPYKILQFNDFGLVAITRKRVKQSLERTLCSPCPYCEGAGYVKSVQTTVSDILQEAHKIAKAVEGKNVMLRVHPDVAKFLKSNQNKYLEEMEEVLRRPVLVKGDPTLHQEKFDLA